MAPRRKNKSEKYDPADRIRAFLEAMKEAESERTKRPKLPQYKEHIVCFMDLLGFREQVMSMSVKQAREEIARLDWLLQSVVEPYRVAGVDDSDPIRIQVNYFSDCFCLALPLSTTDLKQYLDAVFWMLVHLQHVQGELILHDKIVRGGVTIDRHFGNPKLIFSRAEIRAYDIESKEAVFPHLLVDRSVVDGIKKALKRHAGQPYDVGAFALESDIQDVAGLLAMREDGRYFLDYLGFWTELDDQEGVVPFFEKHKSFIETNAKKHIKKGAVLEKYRWMARYHDAYVAKMFAHRPGLKIDMTAFGAIRPPKHP